MLRFFLTVALVVATCTADAADAAQKWRILALRVDFPLEEPDEPTTTGIGRFDLRSFDEALPDYFYPFDTPPHDRTYFENHLRALARYYRTVSEGEVEIEFELFPRGQEEAYSLPQRMLIYGNGRSEEEIGRKWIELFGDAVRLADADSEGPRFADFNSFLVLHAGVGHETGELNDIRSVFLAERDFEAYAEQPVLADEGTFEIREGWILPESPSLRGQAGLNGLLAKFFGHQLGLPGLSNFADGLPAVGGWSLMDVGTNSLGFVLQDSLLPVVGFAAPHPIAWSKARLGWIEPLVVQRDTVVTLLATDRSGELPKAVRIPLDADEYLLLENRQQRGQRGFPEGVEHPFLEPDQVVWIDSEEVEFSNGDGTGSWLELGEYDAFIPGSGLLVWHVDDGVIQERLAAGAINNDPVHPGIALIEADGRRDIGQPVFERLDEIEGSPEDPFFVGGQTRLAGDTQPDTRTYRGWESGVEIEVLSEPGDEMRVEIRFPRSARGWPQRLEGGRRLQAADVDGDGMDELIAEGREGVRMARMGAGLEEWMVGDARFLAAGDVDGEGTIFALRGLEVEAWAWGEGEPRWAVELDEKPAGALFSGNVQIFRGRQVLVLVGQETIVLDGRDGELLTRVAVSGSYPLAADVDGDGEGELIVAGERGVWQLEEGELRSLWEGDGPMLPPAAGDVDWDGRDEIICADVGGRVWLIGEQETGFEMSLGDSLRAGPVIGDMNGIGDMDGKAYLEIVIAGRERIHALQANGLQISNFPVRLPDFADIEELGRSPVLLDLDWDGKQEIFQATSRGVFGIDEDGRMLAGFPLPTAGDVTGVIGADLDGDDRIELAGLGGDWLYVWEPQNFTPEYVGQRIGWGQEGYSAAGVRVHRGMGEALNPYLEENILPDDRVYCYPNPVVGEEEAHLRFFLGGPARVRLEVFDAVGGRVEEREIQGELTAPAENEISWSVADYANGLYICRLEARGESGRKETAFVKMAVSR